MTYAVYIITNIVNAKQYVGITKRLQKRWAEHKRMHGGECHGLYSAIKKYGKEKFVFSHIADAFDKESACVIERLLIKEHNTLSPYGYNLTSGGNGGFEMSDLSKEKMSLAKKGKPSHNKGKPCKPEIVAKISASKKGKPWTKEQREKIIAGQKASKKHGQGMFGKKHSEETKIKMRLAQMARFDAEKAIKKAAEVSA
jgi:group I intron endonuclease